MCTRHVPQVFPKAFWRRPQLRAGLRRILRAMGIRFPFLQRYSGRLGLGRLASGGSDYVQIRLDGDIIIELDLRIPFFHYLYYHHDLSQAPEAHLIRCLVGPDDVYVDIGAHIGYWALLAAKYGGRVLAFEPSAATFAYLQRNLELNPVLARKIVALRIALADYIGQGSLYRPSCQPNLASLRQFPDGDVVVENVSVSTLDHLMQETNVSFIKIDVEGAELKVLRGGAQAIQRSRPLVLCELFEPYQARFGTSCQQIVDFFMNHNYQAYRVQSGKSRQESVILTPLELNALYETIAENALFVPPKSLNGSHLRWFTRHSARVMAEQAGYYILDEAIIYKPHIARFWPSLMGYQIVLRTARTE